MLRYVSSYTVFNICILVTVFQRFDELAFSVCRRVFCLFQNQCCSYINKQTSYRCCHQRVFRQIGVRSIFKKLQGIPGNSKILEKYLWMNSVLIKMQFFSILLYFRRENEAWGIFKLLWSFFDNSYFAEFLSEAYLEPSRTSTMELFWENINYFRKNLYLKCSAGL